MKRIASDSSSWRTQRTNGTKKGGKMRLLTCDFFPLTSFFFIGGDGGGRISCDQMNSFINKKRCIVSECARTQDRTGCESKYCQGNTHTTHTSICDQKNVLKKIPVQTTLVPRINLFLSRRYALNGCYDLVQANFLHHHKESSIFSVRCNVLCSASPEYLMEWKYVIFFYFIESHLAQKCW